MVSQVTSYNIYDSTSTFTTNVTATGKVFALDKDDGTEKSEAQQASYCGEWFGNSTGKFFQQINSVLAGETQITALDIATTLDVDGTATVGQLNIAGTSNSLQVGFGHTNVFTNGVNTWRFRSDLNDGDLLPVGTRSVGSTGSRVATVYTTDLDVADDVTIAGDLRVNNASGTASSVANNATIGTNDGSNVNQGITFMTDAGGTHRLYFGDDGDNDRHRVLVEAGAGGHMSFWTDGTGRLDLSSVRVDALMPVRLPTYTVGTLPTASTHTRSMIWVSDETSGATMAVSDGTNWRRMNDYAVVS